MVRISDVEESLHFYVDLLGLNEVRRRESTKGRFTLIFLNSGDANDNAEVELTYNWDQEPYPNGRNFGHLAFAVDDIYQICTNLAEGGVEILRPPRDGRMAFVRSPDGISIELLQQGDALEPKEPWLSAKNQGSW